MLKNIDSLSLKEKIGQLFFVGIAGTDLDEQTRTLLDDVRPGGICLFSRNIKEAEQTRHLLTELRETCNIYPFLSVDEEGGLVDRLRRISTAMPAASEFRDRQSVTEFARIVAETLRILGFNMNFAPVVDVVDQERSLFSNGLRSRAFGSSTEQVVDLAGTFLEEMQQHGCIGCVKHFPGLGAANVDSHEELPAMNITKEDFLETDIRPFRELIGTGGVHAVMVAHATYPNVDLQETGQDGRLLPSSLSRRMVTGLLRDQLGFDGVVITDDLEMGAIIRNYGIGEACKMAIGAGVDMLAICAGEANIREGSQRILAAVLNGEITEERIDESYRRISRLRSKLTDPLPFDRIRLGQLSNDVTNLKNSLKLDLEEQ
jgi:Beta-glucosidase-related glycosidases